MAAGGSAGTRTAMSPSIREASEPCRGATAAASGSGSSPAVSSARTAGWATLAAMAVALGRGTAQGAGTGSGAPIGATVAAEPRATR